MSIIVDLVCILIISIVAGRRYDIDIGTAVFSSLLFLESWLLQANNQAACAISNLCQTLGR